MTEKKLTSVEWLYTQLKKSDRRMWESLLDEAKEMHRTEIDECWRERAEIGNIVVTTDNRTSAQYYDDTFKKD